MEHALLGVLISFWLNTLIYSGYAQDAELILEPNSSRVFVGERVTLTCVMREADGSDWFYKFIWNGEEMDSLRETNSVSLHLTPDQNGIYRCIGRHRGSSFTKQSNNITLTVLGYRPTATVTAGMKTIPEGGEVTLTCSVEDSAGWKYEWFNHTNSLSKMGFTQNQLNISYGGLYSCRGQRGNPLFFTKRSEMYRIEKRLSNRVSVVLQHNWTQIYSGEMISIRCKIQGEENSEWNYEWRTTGPNIPPPGSELSFTASPFYGRRYWCKGRRDFYSTEWSEAQTVTVAGKPQPTVVADTRTIPDGGNVTMKCSVETSASWTYYWFRHTSNFSKIQISKDATRDSFVSVFQGGVYSCQGGRGNPLFFTENSDAVIIEKRVSNKVVASLMPSWPLMFTGEMVTARCQIYGHDDTEWTYEWRNPNSDTISTNDRHRRFHASESSSGIYQCIGKHKRDSYCSTEWSNTVALKVLGYRAKAHISADSRVFPAGGSVTLTCSVTPASSGWKYYWYRGKKSSALESPSHQEISVSQEGLYWCRGGRGNPLYYTEYSDSVSIDKIASNDPIVTLQPNWPEIYAGETITLRCEIQGGGTEWTYEWMTTSSYTPPSQHEYKITSASSSHSGHYWCKGRRQIAPQNETRWSASLELGISRWWERPVLSVSPSWLSPGGSVTLSCDVNHPSAGVKFFWYKGVPDRMAHMLFRARRFLSSHLYTYELLPGSISGTFQDSYILHGHTNTAVYACRAGRGDPVVYSEYSKPEIVWSAELNSSASLIVSPPRVQHFTSQPISLRCEGNSTEWVIRGNPGYLLERCNFRMWNGLCEIWNRRPRNEVYWCESGSGEFSNAVNITIHGGDVILVSPVYPVSEGTSVTLECKLREDNFTSTVAFEKNGNRIQNDNRRELKISAVSKSDEGFYKCEHSGEASPQSWMSVKCEASRLPVSLIVGLVVGFFMALLLVLLLCLWKKSNGTTRNRLFHSQNSSQASARVQTVNQAEHQQIIYSSLLHADASVYEEVGGSGNTERGGREDEDRYVLSDIHLRAAGQQRKRDRPRY